MGQWIRTHWLYVPQGQFYLEWVHHTVDRKFYCCAKHVDISCMKVGKKNINKSNDLIYILSDNEIVFW